MGFTGDLHSSFCSFLEQMRRPNQQDRFKARLFGSRFPTPAETLDQAFFFDEEIIARDATLGYDQERGFPHPFPAYWLVYRTGNGPFGYIDNAIHVSASRLRFFMRMNRSRWSVGSTCGYENLDVSRLVAQPLDVQEFFPEFLCCLILVNDRNECIRDDRETPEFTREHTRREKQGRRSLPRFITVRARNEQDAPAAGGGGWTQVPHNRRGHWRGYRSGKRVWVQDCAIHGGSKLPRDYRVEHSR